MIPLYSSINDTAPARMITLPELAELIERPSVGPKDKAAALTPFTARGKTKQAAVDAPFWGIVKDHDDDDRSAEQVRALYDSFGVAWMAWSTASHQQPKDGITANRWKVVLPLAQQASYADVLPLALGSDLILGTDKAQSRVQQVFYAPNKISSGAPYLGMTRLDLPLLDPSDTTHPLVRQCREKYEEAERKQAERAAAAVALKVRSTAPRQGGSVIEAVNAAYDLGNLLEHHGYARIGRKWLSPASKSGNPGVVVLRGDDGRERVYSHHGEADPLSNLNHGGHALDAFDVLCCLDYGGDVRRAVRELGARVSAPPPTPTPPAKPKPPEPPPAPKNDAAGLGLKLVEVVDVLEAPPPAPAFWIDELVPAGVVTLLGAHGGTGKSMLALTAAVCLAAGLPFLGKPTRRAKVVFYSGEDPALVLRWRLSLVCKHLNVDPRELEGWLAVIDATEGEPTLFYECTLDGRRVGLNTEVYGELDRIAKAGAEVFIIDNASDTFDADEINRARVRAFIRSLAMLTKPHAGAVLLLAHIDKTSARGFGGKEGYSGSTAWHNSVRSRLFLSESGDGLMLEQQKANLGRKASPMQLDRLEGGVLSLATVGTNPAAGLIASAHRDVVLGMFAEFYDRGEFLPVSQQAPGNAHKALSAERGFPPRMSKAEFWQLVRDAERAGYLVRESYQTKDRKERTRWCVTDSGRKVSGISPPAPTAPTLRQVEVSAPGASGAPTAPTSQGGCGGKMARTSRRKVGALPPFDALPEPGEVGALA